MQGHEFLFTQVLSNWYDRDEDDEAIIAELITSGGPTYVVRAVAAIQAFLDDPQLTATKAASVRDAVWRILPTDDQELLDWLIGVQVALRAGQPPAAA